MSLIIDYERSNNVVSEIQSDGIENKESNSKESISFSPKIVEVTNDEAASCLIHHKTLVLDQETANSRTKSKFCKMQCIHKRYLVTFLSFWGQFVMFPVRINLGIAVVAMTSDQTVTIGNETKIIPAEFQWTSMEKGVIFSAVSFGFLFSFFGGVVAYKFGGATTRGVSVLIMAILEFLSPLFFRIHLVVFLVARAVMGLLEVFALAAVSDTFAHWSPLSERTRLISYSSTGHLLSGAVNYPFSGYLAHTFGWQSIFYTAGGMLFIWSLIWLFLVGNDPADDRFITEKERNYLKSNITDVSTEKFPIPWKSILSSRSVYSILNEKLCASWTSSFIAQLLPLYIKDMHHVNIQKVGLISGLPMLCNMIPLPVVACFADYLRTEVLSVAKVHRIFIFWGQLFILIFLFLAAMCGDFTVSIICLCLVQVAYSFPESSYQVINIDMAGQYASVLKSMMTTVVQIGHFLNPLVVGYLVQNHTSAEWNLYLIVLSSITLYGVIIFLLFGSGETQPWAVSSKLGNNETELSETPAQLKVMN